MRYLTALCVLLITACSDSTTETSKASIEDSSRLFLPSYSINKFQGTYSGTFDDGYMTLVLNYVNGKNVSGFNIHKGNRRNINGTLEPEGTGYRFVLKEPGDNPYDGTFNFIIDTSAFTVKGTWHPYDSAKLKTKTFALQKQANKSISYDQQLGTWIPATGNYSTDTTLDFLNEGAVEFSFYLTPGDSTSQMITVKGNYIEKSDTVFIEWQKNSYTPAQKMKLIRKTRRVPDTDYDEQQLMGHGWKLTKFEGG